ncbi:YbhB/YbcL family Raf kinase inhibitor-like protein [Candidatus Parcubacteria bacterium]|jgi:Raf kinase inhibitor-like YbhB/YbcL family protein|nr:YbhB/YbcL family Raf kinase inhibitor-like protein [Candidatus Parcubacteria bacterium]MBT3949198.1 YbhB/YbcL family Raf kinase inhibitor-like protein [Candidatus Parcubacteria bacterium]
MRKILFLLFGLMIIGVGCSSTQPEEPQGEDLAGVEDLAAIYCEEHGGEIKIAENEYDSTSYCTFPDGTVCEEGEYFRGECGPNQESKSPDITQETMMKFTSTEFENEGAIPAKYSCDGSDINPSLNISDAPEGTKSLALVVDDPDAPGGTWVHWVVWNIDPAIGTIAENSKPGIEGLTSFGTAGWGGPCPPSGTHRYYFKLYALDAELDLSSDTSSSDLEKEMEGHILEETKLMGTYGV